MCGCVCMCVRSFVHEGGCACEYLFGRVCLCV